MYEIAVRKKFAAVHAIHLEDGSLEPLHEHEWTVEVTASADQLDAIETIMDFHQLEQQIDTVIEYVRGRNINDVEPFCLHINPTAERIAWWFGTEITKNLPSNVRLVGVTIGEAPGCTATYRL